jgi:Trk K+ transport system NAD-binding subunit
MDRPIVVCGMGRMGVRVLEYLRAAGMPAVVIDTVCQPDDPRLQGTRLVRGNCTRREVLEEAGVADCGGVLVLTNDDLVNVTTALQVRAITPEVRIVVRMFNQNLLARLGSAVHNVFALSTSLLAAPMLALTAVTGQGLGLFRLDGEEDRRQIAEVAVSAGSALVGRSVVEVASARGACPLAHFREGAFQRHLLEVDLEERLVTGDRLVLCGEPRRLAHLLSPEEGATDLRWANWFRRLGRMTWRALTEIDVAVTVCTLILVLVLALSTLILTLGRYHDRPHVAFLRSVSIMATAGGLPGEELRDSPVVMVYVSVLRIVGAALMATFTAIVTNYLLRARLGGVFEARRIPDGGHVVICGLSTVGFRMVEELIGYGERVVVIEQDQANRFMPTARRLGAAVIVGDAGVSEVLRQARAGTARAVVATTNNDMTNLEVGLLVRELNPTQRVVLLVNDPQFAQMLRDAAHIHLALSVPALAAPAFVAGLFGDRVGSAFLMGDRVYAVVDLIINENDPFVGHAVRAMAYDYRLQPVAVLGAHASCSGTPVSAARLSAGDRLVGIIALTDLNRLLRRQPIPADYAVEVAGFSLPTRPWLVGLTRALNHTSAEEVERALDHLPLRLAGNLTRGQAEDLLAQLRRERVQARICTGEAEELTTETQRHREEKTERR